LVAVVYLGHRAAPVDSWLLHLWPKVESLLSCYSTLSLSFSRSVVHCCPEFLSIDKRRLYLTHSVSRSSVGHCVATDRVDKQHTHIYTYRRLRVWYIDRSKVTPPGTRGEMNTTPPLHPHLRPADIMLPNVDTIVEAQQCTFTMFCEQASSRFRTCIIYTVAPNKLNHFNSSPAGYTT